MNKDEIAFLPEVINKHKSKIGAFKFMLIILIMETFSTFKQDQYRHSIAMLRKIEPGIDIQSLGRVITLILEQEIGFSLRSGIKAITTDRLIENALEELMYRSTFHSNQRIKSRIINQKVLDLYYNSKLDLFKRMVNVDSRSSDKISKSWSSMVDALNSPLSAFRSISSF